ncbi:MAG TPA: zf-HC2 domain-containing protein [Burkholderiales bacterium]
MREMLPDLLNNRLGADARASVAAHLMTCADCRAELAVLRQVRAAASSPAVDVVRIASVIPPYRPSTVWVRMSRSWTVRLAAAVILIVGGATVMRHRDATLDKPDTVLAMNTPSPELAVGALADIPDQDLRALMAELGKIQAVTPAEPDVVVPAVGRAGGGQ